MAGVSWEFSQSLGVWPDGGELECLEYHTPGFGIFFTGTGVGLFVYMNMNIKFRRRTNRNGQWWFISMRQFSWTMYSCFRRSPTLVSFQTTVTNAFGMSKGYPSRSLSEKKCSSNILELDPPQMVSSALFFLATWHFLGRQPVGPMARHILSCWLIAVEVHTWPIFG